MIKCFILGYKQNGTAITVVTVMRDTAVTNDRGYSLDIPTNYSDTSASFNAGVEAAITYACINVDGIPAPDAFVWMFNPNMSSGTPVTPQKFFKASVAGGAGVATFYTDTNGDGTGTALYPSLTADQLSFFVDGVSDQYAFPTITVAGNKKSVTVTAMRQNFTTSNALVNLLGGLVQLLSGVTYVAAANGVGVKMIIGIDD